MAAVHEHHLPNGMTLLCFPQEHLHSVHLGLYLKGGTLYENRQNQGIGHLLEHLCFRGLGELSHDALQSTLSRMGGELSGATYTEAIVFDLSVLPRFFEQATELFLRFFADVPWTQEQIDAEKQVVLRQIEEADCDFEEQIDRRYRRTAAGAFPRMGTVESIMEMTPATIRRWQRAVFQPQNACLCLTGNITDEMEAAAVRAFTPLENHTDEPPFVQAVPKGFCMRDTASDLVLEETGSHAKVHIAFDLDDERVFPLLSEVLDAITGGSDDSLLFQMIREQEALVAEIDSSLEEMGLFRRLVIRYDVRQEHLVESLRKVFALLKRLRMYIRPVRLELARLAFTDNNDMMLDSPAGMSDLMGWAWLADDLSRADLDAQAAMYDDLTTEDLLDAAQSVFRPENLCVTIQRDPALTPKNLKPLLHELRDMLT
ncbi:MAG: insulinase family protein [Christensenellaceae bacterium]|nr:insulinase family protein [Christensenellaceae bacterium]